MVVAPPSAPLAPTTTNVRTETPRKSGELVGRQRLRRRRA
jgi:hypothetical protein